MPCDRTYRGTTATRRRAVVMQRRRPLNKVLGRAAVVLSAVAALAPASAALATSYVWNGTTGNFSTDANWNPQGVPSSSDDSAAINNGGTIQINSDHSFGTTSSPTFFNIGFLTGSADAGTGTVTQTAGAVTNAGTGSLNIGTVAGSTGTYNISGGTLSTGSAAVRLSNTGTGSMNLSGSAAVTSGGGLTIANNNSSVGSVIMSGSATWSVAGSTTIGQNGSTSTATFTIGGLASFSGAGVTIGNSNSTGTLNLNGGTFSASQISKGTGPATINFNGGTVRATAAATYFSGFAATNSATSILNVQAGGLRFDTNSFNVTVAQNLSGAGGVTKSGGGQLTLSGTASSYNGGTTVSSGTLVANPGALGTGSVNVQSGAVFSFSGSNTTNYTQPFQIAGNGAGIGAVRLGALGPVGITLSGGVKLNADAQIGTTSSIGNDITISTNNVDLSTFTLTLGAPTVNSGTYTVSSNVVSTGGGGGLTFSPLNDAALILSGSNTYAGPTTITAGRALINGTHTGGGTYSVAAAGGLGGSGTIQASGVTFADGGRLTPGAAFAAVGTTTLALGAGGMNLSAMNTAGSLLFDLDTPGTSDRVTLTSGTLNLGTLNFDEFAFNPLAGFSPEGGTYVLFDASSPISGSLGTAGGTVGGLPATLSIDAVTHDVVLTVVPEPATASLIGVAGLLLARRRRSRG